MNILTIVMVLVLIGTLFVTDLCSMLMTIEMVLIMILALPIYLYKKRQPAVWNSFLFTMTLSIAARFVTSAYVISHARVVQYPIQIANQNIKQFAGIGVMTIWFIWYILVFASTMFDNHVIIKKAITVDKLDTELHRGTIRINRNFYNVTCVMLCINFIVAIFVYDMKSIFMRVLINVIVVLVTNIAYNSFINDDAKGKVAELCNVDKSHHSKVVVYDVKSNTMIDCEGLSKEDKICQEEVKPDNKS